MAEEETPEAEAGASGAPGVSSAAWGLLGAASRARADAFLERQIALTDVQIGQLAQVERFEQSHLRWRRFNDVMKGGLQIVALVGGVALLGGIGFAMWSASRAEGLVVDAFTVPPSFVEAGVNGDVLAGDITSKLGAIREFAERISISRSQDVRQERGDEIKVEIPETGVSIAQVWRYLKNWLGHERHLAGSVRKLSDGRIALTVALDGQPITVEGAGDALDALEMQAAEQIFARTDPTNIVWYLGGKGRIDEAVAVAGRNAAMIRSSYDLWGAATRSLLGDPALALKRSRISLAVEPGKPTPHRQMMQNSRDLGHDEEMLRQVLILRDILQKRGVSSLRGTETVRENMMLVATTAVGDFRGALDAPCTSYCSLAGLHQRNAEMAARLHDLALSRREAADAEVMQGPVGLALARYYAAMETGVWGEAAAAARRYGEEITAGVYFRNIGVVEDQLPIPPRLAALHNQTMMRPLLAVALARGEDFAGAHAAIDATSADCYACLVAHAQVAGLEKNWSGAESWFRRAVTAAPSIPFAYESWGRMLLAKGDATGAAAKFAQASAKGPHFADALEGWGEALMGENTSHLALPKFQQAAALAPNWKRLHLKWGEALLYSGKREAAAKQFAQAATLTGNPAEGAELGYVRAKSGL